jgi:TonB family protein
MKKSTHVILVFAALIPKYAVGQVCAKQLSVPDYPALALAAQWTGVVDLTVTIGARGQVVSVDGSGSFPYLIEQSKKNVKEWLFCAPKNNGSAHVRLRYDYRLEGSRVDPPPTAKVVLDLGEGTVVITLPPGEPQP